MAKQLPQPRPHDSPEPQQSVAGALRFPKTSRVLTKAAFDAVFEARRSAGNSLLVMYARANALAHSRLGMAVSRKVGNAVARNRWKRLLREAFRLDRAALPLGYDFVIVPRSGSKPTLEACRKSLADLCRRLARSPKGRPS